MLADTWNTIETLPDALVLLRGTSSFNGWEAERDRRARPAGPERVWSGGGPLTANRTEVGPWEEFDLS